MGKSVRSGRGLLEYPAVFAVAVLAVQCSSEEDRPPPYARPPLENPRSCLDLRASARLSGSELRIDGKRVNCAAEGLECSLSGSSEVAGRCDGGGASAFCEDAIWRFRCDTPGDPGDGGGP